MNTYPFFCGKDCGGNACPLLAEVEDGRVTRIRQNPAGGRYLKGCRRGLEYAQAHDAPDRLLAPLVRVGPRGSGAFREAGWDEALALVAERLGEIRARYGPAAVLKMGSAGDTGALHGTGALLSRFFHLAGGCTGLTSNYSCGAAGMVLPYLFGDDWLRSGCDPATMRHAQMIVLWGANLLETRHGAEVPARLLEARRRGAQIVVIDPRRSATVRQAATWWIPCRPGTDAALMLAVLHALLAGGLADRAAIAAYSHGFEALERYVLGQDGGEPRTPEWAAPITGVPAEEIRRFAAAYAQARPAMLFPGYSIQRVPAGEETFRLTVALQIAAGHFGRCGGSTGSIHSLLPHPRCGKLPVPYLPGLPAVPVLRWPEAVLRGVAGGYPSDIRAIYSIGSNFLNQGGNVRRAIAAFEQVEFSVCHDLFLTPTARWCDVVLPAASALEKEDLGLPWAGNYLLYRPRILPPRGQARSDYAILCDLADRLGFGGAFSEGRGEAEWVQRFLDLSEVPDQDAFRREGVYFAPDQERVGLADFAANPLAYPLRTPSGKVEIASEAYRRDTGFPAIPTWQPPPADPRYPLLLITPKSPHRTHSQGSNLPQARRRAAHALEIHPLDAAARGIRAGDPVRVTSPHGSTRLPARLTEDLLPGVVCLPEGIWVEFDEQGEDCAGSANLLTGTEGTAAGANAVMHAVPVEVERV